MRKIRKGISYSRYGYYFTLPFIVGHILFGIIPIGYSIILSFTDLRSLQTLSTSHFVGLKNFVTVLTAPQFYTYLGNVAIIWIMYTIPQMVVASFLAVSFSSPAIKMRGFAVFRVLFYMPCVCAGVAISMLFSMLFSWPYGAINNVFVEFGFDPYNFLQNIWVTRSLIAFICFWQSYGGTMIMLVACIKGINPDVFEAAMVDGANSATTFFRITLPCLRTVVTFMVVTSIVTGLQNFEIIRLLTGGGPWTSTYSPVYWIYDLGISAGKYGQAGAMAITFACILMLLSGIAFYLLRDKDSKPEKKEVRGVG